VNPFFKWAGIALTLIGALALTMMFAGCAGPDIEHNVTPPAPAYDGTSRSSGFDHWLYAADGKTVVGAAFMPEGRDNYNYLLGKFGADLKPPRTTDFGVTIDGGEFDLTAEACTDFGAMAMWDQANEHPPKTFWQKIGVTR
jgi:hypothetical protein